MKVMKSGWILIYSVAKKLGNIVNIMLHVYWCIMKKPFILYSPKFPDLVITLCCQWDLLIGLGMKFKRREESRISLMLVPEQLVEQSCHLPRRGRFGEEQIWLGNHVLFWTCKVWDICLFREDVKWHFDIESGV